MPKRVKPVGKLSDIDSQIIKTLLKNGRTSFGELAKTCKITENAAWKHYRSMEKKGIIKGATAQINYSHFGAVAITTILISVNMEQIEQVMEFLEKISEIRASRQYNSVYNIRAVASLRDLNELDLIKQTIKQRLPTTGLKTYLWTGVKNIPENIDLNGTSTNVEQESRKESKNNLSTCKHEARVDELDKQIAAKLVLDGRVSFNQVAKQVGVSVETVIKRYNMLRERGSIKVTIQINPNVIGYSSILDFNLAFAAPESVSSNIIESISKIPNITSIATASGDYDLQGTALVRDIPELFALQDRIAKIHGVTKFEASTRKIPDRWPSQQQHISTL
ncbi:MAG: Lrp/AsnC family transcriptional regulator [Candidatus Bathyarchaeia archaeon]|jgi:Lrp/AsnC family transcriptional regulator for asnA, asnC and gidA